MGNVMEMTTYVLIHMNKSTKLGTEKMGRGGGDELMICLEKILAHTKNDVRELKNKAAENREMWSRKTRKCREKRKSSGVI